MSTKPQNLISVDCKYRRRNRGRPLHPVVARVFLDPRFKSNLRLSLRKKKRDTNLLLSNNCVYNFDYDIT